MADFYCNVIDSKEYNISTTAGILKGMVRYLDVPIDPSAGNVYHPLNNPWYPFRGIYSVFCSYSNGASLPTIFSFSSGKYDVRGFYNPQQGVNTYAVDLYNTETTPETRLHHVNIYTSSNNSFYRANEILVGTNGVAAMATYSSDNFNNYSSSEGAEFTPNTSSSFGTFTAPNKELHGSYSWRMINASAYLGEAYYNASGLKDTDPFARGGTSQSDGGTGDFNNNSDDSILPSLPSLNVIDTGLITLYSPTVQQLRDFANFLWSDQWSIDTFKKLFVDPMQCIIGLSILPVDIPKASSPSDVIFGNINSGVGMYKTNSQYVQINCGTINLSEYWGAYLDYSPFTKLSIFLPFIGTCEINIDDAMNKSISVQYNIDILTGGLNCTVKCGNRFLYEFNGNCVQNIPINSSDWSSVIGSLLGLCGSVASTAIAGAGGVASAGVINATTAASAAESAKYNMAALAGKSLFDSPMSLMKPDVKHSGNLSGAVGRLGSKKPYFMLTRPRQSLPSKQNTFTGYPSNINMKLSDLSGYTEVEYIRLTNVDATDTEINEIIDLLKGGVIL